jgi:hypothetical protein
MHEQRWAWENYCLRRTSLGVVVVLVMMGVVVVLVMMFLCCCLTPSMVCEIDGL